ncbi:MAG TPA: hypothetical protein VNH40_11895 [Gaiellaceae bacterium]|nr:hypothetical protein [Gaiellaceae bacterium]
MVVGERLVRQMLTTLPTSTAAVPAPTRDEALWAEEVAHVLEGAATLAPAAVQMLRDVLTSLAGDSTLDHTSRRDAGTVLTAIRRTALRVV